jgi:hypothetical protein
MAGGSGQLNRVEDERIPNDDEGTITHDFTRQELPADIAWNDERSMPDEYEESVKPGFVRSNFPFNDP